MSALVYLACVALVTALGLGAAVLAHPAFWHGSLQGLGLEKAPIAAPGSFYATRIAPVMQTRCVGCHGETRAKGQLRLDSFAAAMRGGKDGAVIVPGDAKASELIRRIGLPPSDDKAMPPSGKAPLTADEVTAIKMWVAAGASGDVRTIKGAPKPVVEIVLPQSDPAAVRRARAPLVAAVTALQARFPGVIQYESRSSADLELDASLKGAAFSDADLAALAPLSPRIVGADFSGTAITDGAAPALAAMTALQRLRLARTRIGGKTVAALAGLKALKSVSLVETAAGDAAALRQRGVTVYEGGDAP